MSTPSVLDVTTVVTLLSNCRFGLQDEKQTQKDIEGLLRTAYLTRDFSVESEYRLSDRDIPDFFIDGRIVVEVKLRGWQKKQIYKQLERYAKHDQVESLILVTNVSLGLPPSINGKPLYYISLGKAWL